MTNNYYSANKKLSVGEFLVLTKACPCGRDYAREFKTMREVWDNCDKATWLAFMIRNTGPVCKKEFANLIKEVFNEFAKTESKREKKCIELIVDRVRKGDYQNPVCLWPRNKSTRRIYESIKYYQCNRQKKMSIMIDILSVISSSRAFKSFSNPSKTMTSLIKKTITNPFA